ncbi:calcium uniporter regulatory subunit MCUb, mitochondrial [Lepisosteus oculatus]|uniref:Calcium uniporter regulatory subunit MCUb n=1 Tax=Lepisosteus oculatus TaxID=7918 RepID=W5N393_LEPOC|nr:PREDICTED: calcium uniporter regulatory subunit MCUb, mitochondrial [Lepisosteus oculatus]
MVFLGRVVKLQVAVLRRALSSCVAVKTTSTSRVKVLAQIQRQVQLQWGTQRAVFCSTLAPSNDITVEHRYGRPVVALPLPSRKERCRFTLRPLLMTVGDFVQDIQREDKGVTSVSVLSTDGMKISSSTSIENLLSKDFQLLINDVTYDVHSSNIGKVSSEQLTQLEDMKTLVHRLHIALHLSEHHLLKEKELLEKLDGLKEELTPLEKVKSQVVRKAEFRSSTLMWVGIALLSAQGGALAWLTWWVYSWDIMEPVTYFITYSTSMGALAYFILTKQDYVYPDMKDRQFLHDLYKVSKRQRFDVQKYNKLKEELALVEEDLRRLRNSIQLQLPIEQIKPRE